MACTRGVSVINIYIDGKRRRRRDGAFKEMIIHRRMIYDRLLPLLREKERRINCSTKYFGSCCAVDASWQRHFTSIGMQRERKREMERRGVNYLPLPSFYPFFFTAENSSAGFRLRFLSSSPFQAFFFWSNNEMFDVAKKKKKKLHNFLLAAVSY